MIVLLNHGKYVPWVMAHANYSSHDRCLSASEATVRAWLLRSIPPPARIYVAGCTGEPPLLAGILRAEPSLAASRTFLGVWIPGVNRTDYASLDEGTFAETIFASPDLATSIAARRTSILPLSYIQCAQWLRSTPIDAALIHTSLPDAAGAVSLGVSNDFSHLIMARPEIRKFALINASMPAPLNCARYPLEMFEAVTHTDEPLLTYAQSAVNDTVRAIASHIAALVEDGATVQFGLGTVPYATLFALHQRKNLKIHSGMISDAALSAIDHGLVSVRSGSVTCGVALGSAALYQRVASDPRFRFMPVDYTHCLSTLQSIDRFSAVNSVIEVDLFGQANAEYLDGRQVSGAGGLVDFLRGAAASIRGQPIIALPSTARRGAVSRIVPRLTAPCVSVSRADTGIVATEHGIADLRGRSVEERARALIGIADPKFRMSLQRDFDNLSAAII